MAILSTQGTSTMPPTVLAVKSFLKEDPEDSTVTTKITVTQYCGMGPPPISFGEIGDLFFDLSPGAYRLYARYFDSWREWAGVARDTSKDTHNPYGFRHPLDDSRILWFYNRSLEWQKLSNKRVAGSRNKLFNRRQWTKGMTFISAEQFIERYKIGLAEGVRQSGSAKRGMDVDTDSDYDSDAHTDDGGTARATMAYNLRRTSQPQSHKSKRIRIDRSPTEPKSEEDEPPSLHSRYGSRTSGIPLTSSARARSSSSHIASNITSISKVIHSHHPSPTLDDILDLTKGKDNQFTGSEPSRQVSDASAQPHFNGSHIASNTSSTSTSNTNISSSRTHLSLSGAPDKLTKGEQDAQKRAQEHEELMAQHRAYQTALERRHQQVTQENEEVKRNAERVRERLAQAKQDAIRRTEEANRLKRERETMLENTERLERSVIAKEEENERQRRETEEMEKEIKEWDEIW